MDYDSFFKYEYPADFTNYRSNINMPAKKKTVQVKKSAADIMPEDQNKAVVEKPAPPNYNIMTPDELWRANKDEFFARLLSLMETKVKIPPIFYDYYTNYYNIFKKYNIGVEYSTRAFVKISDSVKIYHTFENFQNDNPYYISQQRLNSWKDKGNIFFDEIQNVWFLNDYEHPNIIIERIDTEFEGPFDIEKHKDFFIEKTTCSTYVANALKNKTLKKVNVATHVVPTVVYSLADINFVEYDQRKEFRQPNPNELMFGLELEILFPTYTNKLTFSAWLGKYWPQWVAKRDGSLEKLGNAGNCGLELVSPPLSEEQCLSEAKIITDHAKKLGAKGHVEGNTFYGMHININVPNGPIHSWKLTAKRFIYLVNNPFLRGFWQAASRRQGPVFDEYCAFQTIRFNNCLETEGNPDDHYRSVFYRRNTQCVEARIFRSNLHFLTISATVELMRLAIEYCRQEKYDIKVKLWYDFLMNNASSNLIEMLTRFRAIKQIRAALDQEEQHSLKQKPVDIFLA